MQLAIDSIAHLFIDEVKSSLICGQLVQSNGLSLQQQPAVCYVCLAIHLRFGERKLFDVSLAIGSF